MNLIDFLIGEAPLPLVGVELLVPFSLEAGGLGLVELEWSTDRGEPGLLRERILEAGDLELKWSTCRGELGLVEFKWSTGSLEAGEL